MILVILNLIPLSAREGEERKGETPREEGGVVFSDMGFYFSMNSFSKLGVVVLF